jgi:hypothetical protein
MDRIGTVFSIGHFNVCDAGAAKRKIDGKSPQEQGFMTRKAC